jgi:hypothetical protein
MRRAVAAALFFVLAILPASAQRGGGRGFAGGGARAGGSFRGGMVARGGSAYRSQVSPRFGFGFYGSGGYRGYGYRAYIGPRYYPGYSPYYFGLGYGYYPYGYYPSYGYYGYYDPSWYGGYYTYSYDDSAQQQAYAEQQQLNNQVNDLNQRVDSLQEQNDALRADLNQRPNVPRPPQASAPEPRPAQTLNEPTKPVVLVYKDGRRLQVHNYAIVGQTLWVLTDNLAKKIPLADLDLNKTQEENEQNGVEFTVPKG